MNKKTLVIALALASPALFAIGCGGMNDTRVVEQPVEQPSVTEPVMDAREDEAPVEDIAEAVFAEVTNEAAADTSAQSPGLVPESLVVSDDSAAARPAELTFYFATNDSSIGQQDLEKLVDHANYLMKNPALALRISGHTDQSGSREYNQWLARQRAEAVAKVLIDYGVQPTQIHIQSLGEDNPIAGLEHAIADRRVELEYASETRVSEANSF